jgi:hypothetical protein
MAAILLASKILTLPKFKLSVCEKAKFVIKIDIVKPIPPKTEAPNNCLIEIFDDMVEIFNLLPI